VVVVDDSFAEVVSVDSLERQREADHAQAQGWSSCVAMGVGEL
jgi:hypothetical protein